MKYGYISKEVRKMNEKVLVDNIYSRLAKARIQLSKAIDLLIAYKDRFDSEAPDLDIAYEEVVNLMNFFLKKKARR